jgi:hypothetical protein
MAANYSFPKTIRDRVLLWLHGNRFGLYGDGQATTNSAAVLDGVVVGSVRSGANSLKGIASSLASGTGAVTLAGTQVGDTVELVLDMNASPFVDVTADFESTISAAGQIQQTTALSNHSCLFFINPQAAA